MSSRARLIAALLCLVLTGCTTTLHGQQSAGGGTITAATAGSVSGSHGSVSFSSGSTPPVGAPGGQAVLGRGGSAVLFLGLVVAETFNFLAAPMRGTPPPSQASQLPASISHTCSCYGYKPVTRDE